MKIAGKILSIVFIGLSSYSYFFDTKDNAILLILFAIYIRIIANEIED